MSSRIQSSNSLFSLLVILSVLSGLIFNLVFASIQPDAISIYNLGIDTGIYRSFALNLTRTGVLDVPHAFAPGIVFYLSAIFFSFGYSPFAVKIVNCLLIAVISSLGAWLGRYLYNARAGLFCSILLSFSPLLRSYGMTFQYEVLVVFLFTASLSLLLWSLNEQHKARTGAVVAAGAFLGLSALTREVFLTVLPLFVLVLLHTTARNSRWRLAALFILAFVPPVLWWIGRVYVLTGELVPISMKGPFNLMAGNNPLANGTFNLNELPMVNGDFQIPSPHGVAFWLQEPRASIELISRKFLLFWGFLKDGWDVPHPFSMILYHLSFHQAPLHWCHSIARASLSVFCFIGVLFALRIQSADKRNFFIFLSVLFIPVLGSHLAMTSSHRYLIPLLVPTYIFAGITLSELIILMNTRSTLICASVITLLTILGSKSGLSGNMEISPAFLDGFMISRTQRGTGRESTSIIAPKAAHSRVIGLYGDDYYPQGSHELRLQASAQCEGLESSTKMLSIRFTNRAGRGVCRRSLTCETFREVRGGSITVECLLRKTEPLKLVIESTGVAAIKLDRIDILLADEISGISSSQLRAVYRAGCLLRHSVSGGEEPEPTTNIPRTRAK